ncbi:MAG TPA: tetratricopeptide repeat protein, partial [Vicinamibacterales bacterium]
ALAGQGYAALARNDEQRALSQFDAALANDPNLAAAYVGRGQALLRLGQAADALESFERARTADPRLDLAARIETLRFRVLDDLIGQARQLASRGDIEGATAAYTRALRASPQSAVLYRELAALERRAGRQQEARAHLEAALNLDPADRQTHVMLGELQEAEGDLEAALASYVAAQRIESTPELEARLASLRERADLARLPEAFRTLASRPTASRADLAAALGLRLPGVLARAPQRPTPVLTDLGDHWAQTWALGAVRAGVMDAFPNHTFQPDEVVRRADLATAAARVIQLLAVLGDRRADGWRQASVNFPDLPPEHPSHAAAAAAVAAGVMEPGAGGAFEPTRAVNGAELLEAVARLQRLAGPLASRDRLGEGGE